MLGPAPELHQIQNELRLRLHPEEFYPEKFRHLPPLILSRWRQIYYGEFFFLKNSYIVIFVRVVTFFAHFLISFFPTRSCVKTCLETKIKKFEFLNVIKRRRQVLMIF